MVEVSSVLPLDSFDARTKWCCSSFAESPAAAAESEPALSNDIFIWNRQTSQILNLPQAGKTNGKGKGKGKATAAPAAAAIASVAEVDKACPKAGDEGVSVCAGHDVKLNQTNIAANNNKFYVLQVGRAESRQRYHLSEKCCADSCGEVDCDRRCHLDGLTASGFDAI